MFFMLQNKNLFVIAVISVVNALGYGIIIPILYTYSQKFGLSDFQNGLLFALFSVCQFLATPVIGRLSDRYGRKPLLLLSLGGTGISFLMAAFAPSAIWLFISRALDGITAGNIPVAAAVISDTTAPEDRSRGFGIIGAAFGFGFIFGPAISALTIPWGMNVPFIIAAAVAGAAVTTTWLILPETNRHLGKVKTGKLFDFKFLVNILFDKAVGKTLTITLLYSFAFGLFIFIFQPFSVKLLGLSAQKISLIFTLMGVMGVVAQAGIITRFTKRFGEVKSLTGSFIVMCVTFGLFFFTRHFIPFVVIALVYAVANAFIGPLVQALLSKEADVKSQGSIMGLNVSYMSLGMIFGPIVGGVIATWYIPAPFLVGSVIFFACAVISLKILKRPRILVNAFKLESGGGS